jgi:hypothetical protein
VAQLRLLVLDIVGYVPVGLLKSARSGEELRTGESRVAFLQAEMTMLMIQRAQLLRLSLLRRTVRPRDCCCLGQRENVPFLSFPYVCPKPVLVK